MKKYSSDYTYLGELENFKTGYIIIESELFLFKQGQLEEYWDLTSTGIEEKVSEARKVAELSNRRRIVVDDEGCYSADIIHDEGELLTPEESYARMDEEDQDDYDSFAEHCFDL